jgi:hypothetical protein
VNALTARVVKLEQQIANGVSAARSAKSLRPQPRRHRSIPRPDERPSAAVPAAVLLRIQDRQPLHRRHSTRLSPAEPSPPRHRRVVAGRRRSRRRLSQRRPRRRSIRHCGTTRSNRDSVGWLVRCSLRRSTLRTHHRR